MIGAQRRKVGRGAGRRKKLWEQRGMRYGRTKSHWEDDGWVKRRKMGKREREKKVKVRNCKL